MAGEIKIDAEIDRIVYQDEPTGLHNRRYLYTALRERVDWNATRAPVSVVILGVDRPPDMRDYQFSSLVRDLGKRLKEAADPEAILVRFSTDAYALLLLQRSREVALKLGEELAKQASADPVQKVQATFCLGAAGRPEDAPMPAGILDAAQRALRAARRAGPGSSSFAPPPATDPDLLARIPSRATIGREQALTRLQQVITDLKKPTFILALGPAGFGKSRFLNDALKLAFDMGQASARADCEEASRHSPYRTVGTLVERLGRELADLELRAEDRLTSEHLMALRVISPNFLTSGELDAAAELPNPQVAGAAVLQLLRIVAGLRPGIVLTVGNAPIVDPSSLEVYRGLLTAPLPLLLLMTCTDPRGVADEGESPFPLFLEGMRKQRRVEEIEMRGLTTDQVRGLTSAIVPERPEAPELDTAMATQGRGSPLYVEEVVRTTALTGRTFAELAPSAVPPSPRHAVLASLAALPAQTREALHCASVMGTTFDVDILQEMLAWRDLELQDALDRAAHARVIRIADPRVPEVMEFSCGFARASCYESIDLLARRRFHLRVGKICEARLPEDAGWLVEAAVFHLERSGSVDRGESLRSLRDKRSTSSAGPVGARIQRIAPGTTPLTTEGQNVFDTLSRALVGALRIGRLYPQGSQLSSGFTQQVKASLDQLLGLASPVTLAVDGQLLKANNVSLPVRPGSAREDLRTVIEDRLVSQLTFQRGITPDELDAVIAGLSESIPHSAMSVDHWDKFIIARGLKNADIVQRAYVAHRASGTDMHAVAERTFDTAGIKLLHEALRYFKASADSLKLYPPGHALVQESLNAAEKPFEELLKEYPSVTIATAEGRILANGKPIEARAMAETGEFLQDQIARRKLLSVTFLRGLTVEEMRTLAAFFALPADDPEARMRGDRMLVEANIRHFRFGARVYARRESVKEGEQATEQGASEAMLLPTAPTVGRPPKRVSVSPRARADVRARVFITKPPADLLTESFEKSLGPLLEALNFGSMCDLAVQLVQHFCGALRDPNADNRSHALRILSRALVGTSTETQRMVVSATAPSLREVVRTETSPPAAKALVDTLAVWTGSAASVGQFAPLVEVLRDGVAQRRNNPATPSQIVLLLNELGRNISQKKFMPALLERMRKGNRDDRELAAQLLASLGDGAASPLIEAIVGERTLPVRQALAGALKLIGPTGAQALARQVQSDTECDRAVAVLEVVELAGASGLDEVFIRAMQSPEEAVRAAAAALLKRLPRSVTTAVLRRALKEMPEEVRPMLVRLATELRAAELATDICTLLEADPPPRITTACCHYFAAVPTRAAAPLLSKIAETRPRMFGMVRGYPDDIRAAAVWALGQLGTDDVKKMLEKVGKEGNTTIRMAVSQALKAAPAAPPPPQPEQAPKPGERGTAAGPKPEPPA